MKKTPLHDAHVELGAKMTPFAGYDMPIQYTKVREEHEAVRNDVGVFDVSHMGEFYVFGKKATPFMDYVFTNNVRTMSNGDVAYGFLCQEDGGTVDDLLVYKYNENFYLLVVNAANKDKDFEWLDRHKTEGDLSVVDKSDQYSQLALQGPNSEKVLNPMGDADLGALKAFRFIECVIEGMEFLVSRTGYTGEDGFEIYGEHEDIIALWEALLQKGVKPIGLGARDTLRYEAALPLYGHEISETISPIEAGYSFAVDFDKDFLGKEALLKQKKAKKRRLVGLELLEKGIPREGYPVLGEEGEEVGHITTGYLSPSMGKPLAMAIINKPHDKRGTTLKVKIRKREIKAKVIKKKLLQKT
ncbi:MAG: glycine cleavage system aminomethyltransferase GcvT [Candidatus Izemoplasmataceae bacterium]